MFFLSQYVERWDKKMSYFGTKNVLFRHRFPVLFLLPRYDESWTDLKHLVDLPAIWFSG